MLLGAVHSADDAANFDHTNPFAPPGTWSETVPLAANTEYTAILYYSGNDYGHGSGIGSMDGDFAWAITGQEVVTPEPATLVMMASGLGAVGAFARRRRK